MWWVPAPAQRVQQAGLVSKLAAGLPNARCSVPFKTRVCLLPADTSILQNVTAPGPGPADLPSHLRRGQTLALRLHRIHNLLCHIAGHSNCLQLLHVNIQDEPAVYHLRSLVTQTVTMQVRDAAAKAWRAGIVARPKQRAERLGQGRANMRHSSHEALKAQGATHLTVLTPHVLELQTQQG